MSSSLDIPQVLLNNNITIPQFGLGVWQAPDGDAERAVANALDIGYRLIDTASMYGNERGVGRAIAASSVPRDELFVTTKYWPTGGPDAAVASFERSLDNLALDYIDLFLIHWPPEPRDNFLATWRVFEQLLDSGRVRSIGVSNYAISHLDILLSGTSIVPAVNQVEIHPDLQQNDLIEYCKAHGIAIESWSPLGGSSRGDHSLLENETIAGIAASYGKTNAQVILRWHIDAGHIVIPKSSHAERIRENSDIFDFALSADDMAAIATLDNSPLNRVGPDPAVSVRL